MIIRKDMGNGKTAFYTKDVLGDWFYKMDEDKWVKSAFERDASIADIILSIRNISAHKPIYLEVSNDA